MRRERKKLNELVCREKRKCDFCLLVLTNSCSILNPTFMIIPELKYNSVNEFKGCKYPNCIFIVIFVIDRLRQEIRTEESSGKIFASVIESV